ncbi:MAG TPA: branched-chain amino acid ABC transporter permease [Nocardioides sp.]|uniref:branched-chain amino acid ABC transporter permease n=1 Tax=Nocardioides sp. TaxID=35761 RepID=UPI002E305D91|nr:branched-chain amino acid ABC transporter permease [Nocardioides sp.]HEX5090826.1 branched-chain amino acid ABC transporter permease [Nocardioides sp.]
MRRLAAAAWRITLTRHLVTAAAGLLVLVVVMESVDDFRAVQLTEMAYLGIAAGGLTLLTGLNGQISLGHGALMAVGAYTTALLVSDDPVVPLVVAIVLATAATTAVGVLIGAAAARLRGPYLAGATLALAVALPGLALHFKGTLGGEQGLRLRVPETPGWVLETAFFITGHDLTRSKYVAYIAWLTLVVVYLLLANLARSRVGRRWRAVRDDEVAAELAGIHLGRARVSAFVVSAAAAGAAGSVMALAVRLTAPTGFTLTLSLGLLTAVVLGGLGSLTGALVGAALLTFLPSVITDAGTSMGLDDIAAAELAPLVYGVVLVLVILLAPRGLVGGIEAGWRRLRHHRHPVVPPGSITTSDAAPSRAPVATSKGDSR